jgi:hypothetical protein
VQGRDLVEDGHPGERGQHEVDAHEDPDESGGHGPQGSEVECEGDRRTQYTGGHRIEEWAGREPSRESQRHHDRQVEQR